MTKCLKYTMEITHAMEWNERKQAELEYEYGVMVINRKKLWSKLSAKEKALYKKIMSAE